MSILTKIRSDMLYNSTHSVTFESKAPVGDCIPTFPEVLKFDVSKIEAFGIDMNTGNSRTWSFSNIPDVLNCLAENEMDHIDFHGMYNGSKMFIGIKIMSNQVVVNTSNKDNIDRISKQLEDVYGVVSGNFD